MYTSICTYKYSCYQIQVWFLPTQKPVIKKQVFVEAKSEKSTIWEDGGLASWDQLQEFYSSLTVSKGSKGKESQ